MSHFIRIFALLCIFILKQNSCESISLSNDVTLPSNVNDGFIWIENNGKIALSYSSHHKQYLPLNITFDLFYFDEMNYIIYATTSYLDKTFKIIQYDVKKHILHDLYSSETNANCYSSILANCTANTCSFYVDATSNILYFATKYSYFYLDPESMEFNVFSLCTQCYHNGGKISVYNNHLYHLMKGVGILMIKRGSNQQPEVILEYNDITSFVIDRRRYIVYFNVNDRIYYTNLHSYHPITALYVDITHTNNTKIQNIRSLNINADASFLFIEYHTKQSVFIGKYPTFTSTAPDGIAISQYLLDDPLSTINTLSYFPSHRRIVAISSSLSYGDGFLSDIQYLWNISYDAVYLDDENDVVYILDVTQKTAKIRQYNLKTELLNDVYHFNKNIDDNSFLWQCQFGRCSIYVDGNNNTLYLAHPGGYLVLPLQSHLMVKKGSWNKEYLYRFGKIMVHNDYLYFMTEDIGILRKKHYGSTEIFIDKTSLNHHRTITSFTIDKHRDILYFSTNNTIYHTKTMTQSNAFGADLNINFQPSTIEYLEINMNGTMLFIQYTRNSNVKAINWPTIIGCTSCVPLEKPLEHKVLFRDIRKNMQSEQIQIHSNQGDIAGSARKLLVANFTAWRTSTVTLPRGDRCMAVGYSNGSIFLFGGKLSSADMIQYVIDTDTVVDYPTTTLSAAVYGVGQFYSQINDTLFMIDTQGLKLSVYNFTAGKFVYDWKQVQIPVQVNERGCLAAHDTYLFVTGGATAGISNLQILDLISLQWDIDAPSMQYRRGSHTCNVHPITKELYVIAGVIGGYADIFVENVEKVSVSGDINSANWMVLADVILPTRFVRSVVFENEILVIGGDQNDAYKIRVQSINCITGQISTDVAQLSYEVTKTAVIRVDNVVYAFGGKNAADFLNTFQYSTLFTYVPTPSPTDAPTVPSFHPTKGPTILPSKAPSDVPSVSPIRFPSILPSKSPTNVPSVSPTPFPSLSPSLPTAAPTFSPICIAYNSTLHQLDLRQNSGILKHYQDYYEISTTDLYTVYEGNKEFELYSKTIECLSDDKSACYIRCITQQSCIMAKVQPITSLSLLSIICNGTKSCKDMNVVVDNINTDHIVVICNASLSCNDMSININHDNSPPLEALSVYCVNEFSCYGMQININGTVIKHDYDDYKILCQTYNACNNLKITERNIKVTMIIYEYSDDITIKNDIGFIQDSIICGKSSDVRAIMYNVDDFSTDSNDVYFEIQSLYTFHRFPCEGIVFECIQTSSLQSCDVTYEFVAPSSLIPIDYSLGALCYEINILYLQNIFCDLKCDNDETANPSRQNYSTFDIDFEYHLIFTDNSSTEANLRTECQHFFGDKQSTKLSLQRINEIYSRLLSLFVQNDYIESIHKDPETILLSNTNPAQKQTFSNCSIENDDISIRLHTYFQINDTSNTNEMEELFSDASFFHKQTTDLLYDYFDVRDIIDVDVIINQTVFIGHYEANKSYAHFKWGFWGILGITALVITLLCIIYRKYKSIQKAAMKLTNPLVVLLGIGDYDDDNIPDLMVDIDINNLKQLFNDTLHYETVPQYNDDPKLHWTQEEMIDEMNNYAEFFENNIDKYDALVVVVSAHGYDNNIICSDSNEITKNAIHRTFSTRYRKAREKPRVIIYDCCDGADEQIKGRNIVKRWQPNIGKNYDVDDIPRVRSYTSSDDLWQKNEYNPDHKLATIHAANLGFQSKMNTDIGSYMIYHFVRKLQKSLDNHNNKFLYEIFDEIQHELGALRGKQLPVYTYNNGTRFIKFLKNTDISQQEADSEHVEIGKLINTNNAVIDYESKEVEVELHSIKYMEEEPNDNILLHIVRQIKSIDERFDTLENKLLNQNELND